MKIFLARNIAMLNFAMKNVLFIIFLEKGDSV